MDLTSRQQEILAYVNTHVDEHGYPPTVREIGQAVGLTSPSTVHAHLEKLEKAGLIRRDATKPRALEVIEGGRSRRGAVVELAPPRNSTMLPLVGDEDATVKRFFREDGRVRLQPENDALEPMFPNEVHVLGTVKAVLRRL